MWVSTQRGALSPRIKQAVSAMRIGKLTGEEYKITWPRHFWCHCPFRYLFKNDIEIPDDKIPKDAKILGGWRFYTTKEEPKNIDFMFDKVPEPIKSQFLECYKELIISDSISELVNNYIKENGEPTIAVHARTWFDMPADKRRPFNIKDVEMAIQSVKNKQENIFVCSDDPKTEEYLRRKYHCHSTKKMGNVQRIPDIESVKDALVDILIGSKANKLILTHTSTFSENMWWFGQGKAQVIETSRRK